MSRLISILSLFNDTKSYLLFPEALFKLSLLCFDHALVLVLSCRLTLSRVHLIGRLLEFRLLVQLIGISTEVT